MSSSLERPQADAAQYQLALSRSRVVGLGNPSHIDSVELSLRERSRLGLRNRFHEALASAKNDAQVCLGAVGLPQTYVPASE